MQEAGVFFGFVEYENMSGIQNALDVSFSVSHAYALLSQLGYKDHALNHFVQLHCELVSCILC